MNIKKNGDKSDHTKLHKFVLMNVILVSSFMGINLAVYAAEDTLEIEEIVVTATKRATSLQKTPLAITAFTRDDIETAQLVFAEDLGVLVPSLVFAQSNAQQQISIRGVGFDNPFMTGEAGVALYIDGVYMGRPNIATVAFSDLERIEVVRGPQGTLQGRNSTGGSLNLITALPSDEFEGAFSLSSGNFDTVDVGGMVSGPLSAKVRARANAAYRKHDGYTDNLVTGNDLDDDLDISFRGTIQVDLTEHLTSTLRADYQTLENSGPTNQPHISGSPIPDDVVQVAADGGRFTNNPRTVYHDNEGEFKREYWGASLTIEPSAGRFDFKSITAYRDTVSDQVADYDGTDGAGPIHAIAPTRETAQQFSQELQVSSKNDGSINWLLGAYFFTEDTDLNLVTNSFGLVTSVDITQETSSIAAFLEGYVDLTDRIKLTVGTRYTRDEKDFSTTIAGPVDKSNDRWDRWTPKIGLDFKISDDIFAFLTISRGFKGGGFNGFSNTGPYDPEELQAYQAGLKSQFMDNRIQLNLAGFYYEYEDIQVTQFTFSGPDISNAASATIRGIEIDVQAFLTDGLKVGVSGTYLDTEYDPFLLQDLLAPIFGFPPVQIGGNELIKAPEYSVSANIEYEKVLGSLGTVRFRYDFAYKDDFFFSVFNDEAAVQDSYAISNVRISLTSTDGKWQIALYGKNLFDEDVLTASTQASALLAPIVNYSAPRTYGVMLGYNFQ